ncbi:sigma-70 family RNA polymerase sigma factor [Thalassoglobus sp. JC818]|uniref:sigma-70 family RNA polymerase sigma factor n=1 Tax=Thalassoglobus sp. JC818 TaxID=3232136 RepID=UPI0034593987
MSSVTEILFQIERGDSSSAEALLPLVYDELRKLAADKLESESPGQTLQATALVHEVWLRLVDVSYSQHWSSRRHFFGAAAEAMRRILIDRARKRNRLKHGGDCQRITLQLDEIPEENEDDLIEALDEALRRFQKIDPVACELVKLRYFAGLTGHDAAETLEISPRTADRLWSFAKAWLLREVQNALNDSP